MKISNLAKWIFTKQNKINNWEIKQIQNFNFKHQNRQQRKRNIQIINKLFWVAEITLKMPKNRGFLRLCQTSKKGHKKHKQHCNHFIYVYILHKQTESTTQPNNQVDKKLAIWRFGWQNVSEIANLVTKCQGVENQAICVNRTQRQFATSPICVNRTQIANVLCSLQSKTFTAKLLAP